jgi:hypothetical protein
MSMDAGNDDVTLALRDHMKMHKKGMHLAQAKIPAPEGFYSSWKAHGAGHRMGEDESAELLFKFAVMLFTKFNTAEAAFRAFDVNANGTLRVSEFVQAAKTLRFGGDTAAVFKALDCDRQGDVSISEFKLLKWYHELSVEMSKQKGNTQIE